MKNISGLHKVGSFSLLNGQVIEEGTSKSLCDELVSYERKVSEHEHAWRVHNFLRPSCRISRLQSAWPCPYSILGVPGPAMAIKWSFESVY